MYGILVVSLEIGIFLKSPARNWRDLVRALALVGMQAVIPVLLFFWWRWHVVPPTVPEFLAVHCRRRPMTVTIA